MESFEKLRPGRETEVNVFRERFIALNGHSNTEFTL
jgi:hypothetical protein